jgi:hypothetical protein
VLGFVWAAFLASLRVADELPRADEGRDVRIVGIVSGLTAQLERGARFEFDIERVLGGGVAVPSRISLAWYEDQVDVRPAERWEFTVRLKRPHGSVNPGGFDAEGWMLERNLRASGYVRDGRAASPQRLADWTWSPALIDRMRYDLRERLRPRLQDARYGGVLIAVVYQDRLPKLLRSPGAGGGLPLCGGWKQGGAHRCNGCHAVAHARGRDYLSRFDARAAWALLVRPVGSCRFARRGRRSCTAAERRPGRTARAFLMLSDGAEILLQKCAMSLGWLWIDRTASTAIGWAAGILLTEGRQLQRSVSQATW